MSKGVETRAVFFIVAVVVGLFILWFLLSRLFPSIMYEIMKIFGVVKPSNIENAILCSYHRCIDGCMSAKVQGLSWEEDGKTVNCNEKFCSELPDNVYEDVDGNGKPKMPLRVCGKGKDSPVNITLKKNEEM